MKSVKIIYDKAKQQLEIKNKEINEKSKNLSGLRIEINKNDKIYYNSLNEYNKVKADRETALDNFEQAKIVHKSNQDILHDLQNKSADQIKQVEDLEASLVSISI